MTLQDRVGGPRSISVDGVQVADLSRRDVIWAAGEPATGQARLVFALHVGGLLHLDSTQYREALSEADLVYADGAAVVALARAGGARHIERAPTTDIGIPALERLGERLGRRPRVAVVGGHDGLAAAAGEVLERAAGVEVVYSHHGYFEIPEQILDDLQRCRPDALVLGLGMPKEALWAHTHREQLPPTVVLTCGGWFGFLTGQERRAPELLQRLGLEWTFRLAQDCRRLSGRYARGLFVSVRMLPGQVRRRSVNKRLGGVTAGGPGVESS